MRTPQSHTALENPPSQSTLEDLRMPVQAKLAAAWTSFMFLYVYVDILAFYKPGVVDDILVGVVWEFDITQTWATTALTLLAIPIFMVVLSMTLPARANRITNLIVASVHIPFAAFNAVGELWTWMYFYVLSVGLEVLVLAFILRSAWTWPRRTASPATLSAAAGTGAATAAVVFAPRGHGEEIGVLSLESMSLNLSWATLNRRLHPDDDHPTARSLPDRPGRAARHGRADRARRRARRPRSTRPARTATTPCSSPPAWTTATPRTAWWPRSSSSAGCRPANRPR